MSNCISRVPRGSQWPRRVALLLAGSLLPAAGWAQQAAPRTAAGRITADDGEPLAGATVALKGTPATTTTDAEGRYALPLPDSARVLVVRAAGYAGRELPARAAAASLALTPETPARYPRQQVGYGTQPRRQATGAATTLGPAPLHEVAVANIGQALQGRVPGLSVASAGTAPGQQPVLRIRGNHSFLNGGDPLLVVDGVPFDGSLNDLNPDDIVTVDVLRDGAATAVYGGRGANGVLLLTTRRGRAGAPRVSYRGYAGPKSAYGRYDLQNGAQYYAYRLQAFRAADPGYSPTASSFLTADERANYAAGKTTDYQSLLFQQGHLQNHTLGLSGGTNQTRYAASLGYYDETGLVPVQRLRRYALHATLDQHLGRRGQLGLSTLATTVLDDDPDLNVLYRVLTTSPLASPTDAAGNPVLYPTGDQAGANPLALYVPGAHLDQHRRWRSFTSAYGQVNLLPGLDLRANVGVDVRSQTGASAFGSSTPQTGSSQSSIFRTTDLASNLLLEGLLTYRRTLGRHSLQATGLLGRQHYHAESTTSGGSSDYLTWQLNSLMGRLHYACADRYAATFTYRNDGASWLAPGSKHGGFFGAGAAWNLAQERWVAGHDWLSLLKLRASLGRVGEAVRSSYLVTGGVATGYYNYGGTTLPSGSSSSTPGWNHTTSVNFGLDFGFFHDRLTGSLDVYRQRSADLLLPEALPGASGYSAFARAGGQVQNQGLEIGLTTVNARAGTLGGFAWSTEWNFTVNREKVLDLKLYDADGSPRSDISNQRFIGQPLYVFYDYQKLGIWQTAEADQARKYGSKPGQIKVADQNNDGRIDASDRVVVGTRQPRFEAGLTNRLRCRGFDLTVVAFTRVGATVVDPVLFGPNYFTTNTGRRNQLNLNYWTPTNPSNDYPQPDQSIRANEYPTYSSTLSYRDGTFLKVRSLDLGYAWVGAARLASARVYVQVQNPLIWARDPYFQANKAIDPDALTYSTRFNSANPSGIGFTGGNPAGTADLGGMGGNYPVARAFLAGVSVEL